LSTRRVLHVIPFLWSGAGRVVTRLCEEQAARGVDVHIATTGRAGTERDWPAYRRRLKAAGVTWHRLNTFHRQPDSLWPAADRARVLASRLQPDVIHAHAGVPTLVATLAASRSAGLKARTTASTSRTPRVIGQMYSWGPNRPSWMDAMDLLAFSRADQVVVSARKYERLLLNGGVGKSRLTYVPWGIDVSRGLTPPSPRRSHVTLGFVGRLEPRKDQLTLVEAVAHLIARGVDARLTLVGPDGDADYGAAVRARVRDLGLGSRVRVTGAVRSIWPHLSSMDLFVSLSKDEGQGLAVLEAMGAGVPVMARPAAGLEDFIVDGRNALSLKGTAPRALGRQLADALADRKRLARVAARARRMVNDRYSWKATLRTLETVYGW
jgi:glycosyltransferase involved in cell wall biosynthesis